MAEGKKDSSGLVFVGCMFAGIGLGLLFDQAGAGVLLGMGVGFLGMWYVRNRSS